MTFSKTSAERSHKLSYFLPDLLRSLIFGVVMFEVLTTPLFGLVLDADETVPVPVLTNVSLLYGPPGKDVVFLWAPEHLVGHCWRPHCHPKYRMFHCQCLRYCKPESNRWLSYLHYHVYLFLSVTTRVWWCILKSTTSQWRRNQSELTSLNGDGYCGFDM